MKFISLLLLVLYVGSAWMSGYWCGTGNELHTIATLLAVCFGASFVVTIER